ncbi:MAG: ABC transporter ATP-binding protein [Rubrivivax sp.]|nr:ABC transporter ATP-binding protein [Rubrivivax sp.]
MIDAQQLCRRYGDLVAVDDVSFHIGRGEIVGLLGHNGAGKTTIMKMMTGYLEPTSGRVLIDGEEVRPESAATRRRIGYLPENCPVWPEMTVLEYLDYQAALHGVPAHERDGAVARAVRRTELGSRATAQIGMLSRGYRQRVGVAQALLHAPDILILDEPTNGLDPTQIRHMRDLIRELAAHATVIVSTHILQEVQAVCQRALIMRGGRLVVDARLADLAHDDGLRLTVAGDARAVLAGVHGVQAVQELGPEPGADAGREPGAAAAPAGLRHYHVQAERTLAPQLVQALARAGLPLHALQPARQDLETVFARVNEAPAHAGAVPAHEAASAAPAAAAVKEVADA